MASHLDCWCNRLYTTSAHVVHETTNISRGCSNTYYIGRSRREPRRSSPCFLQLIFATTHQHGCTFVPLLFIWHGYLAFELRLICATLVKSFLSFPCQHFWARLLHILLIASKHHQLVHHQLFVTQYGLRLATTELPPWDRNGSPPFNMLPARPRGHEHHSFKSCANGASATQCISYAHPATRNLTCI